MNETGAKTILLVEDQAIIAMAEADMLGRNGYDVVIARSGEDAIRVFSDTPRVDLVLLSSIEMALDLFEAHERAALGERRLQRAQTLARLGSYERDKRTGETEWSVQVPELLGDPGAQPSRERLLQSVHPEDRPLIDEAVRAAHLAGDRFDVEYRIVTPKGEECWIHDRAEYWRDSSGEPVRVFGVLQDITERKRAELLLQARDEERALLLREIHHRVKNNMETIEVTVDGSGGTRLSVTLAP